MHKARHGITGAGRNGSVEEQPVIFMHGCREGSKASAKTDCQSGPHLLIHCGSILGKPVQHSKYQQPVTFTVKVPMAATIRAECACRARRNIRLPHRRNSLFR